MGGTMRRTLKQTASLILILILAIAFAVPSGAVSARENGGKLSKEDRAAIARARAQGQGPVTLLIASQPGSNRSVAGGVAGLGGTVRYQDDDLDYLRAIVPLDKVDAVAALSGVQTGSLDEIIPLEDPRPNGAGFTTPQVPPGPSTPRNNPYMPIADTGAAQFTAANPTWDGRGVTVGILDSGVDLAHPALATTS